MDKYFLLMLLNIPFVLFGIIYAFIRYKEGFMGRLSLLIRLLFWSLLATGLLFAHDIYRFLIGNNLSDSPPLSLADVILVTGVSVCLFLCIRLYAKLDHTERKLTELHERLSVLMSEKKK